MGAHHLGRELDEKYSPVMKSYTLPTVPPPSLPQPIILSRGWFRNHKTQKKKLLLPPILQARFPFNYVRLCNRNVHSSHYLD